MAAEELLLLLRREGVVEPVVVAAAAAPLAPRVGGREGASQLTRTALEHRGHRVALHGVGDGGRLGHEVEVEELDELELDLAGGRARLEERGDGQQAVEGFECARVARGVDEGDDERQQRGRLDRGAVVRLEKVEEELFQAIGSARVIPRADCGVATYIHVLLAREQRLAGRVKQKQSLGQVQGVEDEQIVLAIVALSQQAVQSPNETEGYVPLEALLQLEELAEGRVLGQLREILPRCARILVIAFVSVLVSVDTVVPAGTATVFRLRWGR